eukprot:COSAG04_NODE_4616_length_1988_cov_1.176284_2_plen_376_part_00
MDDSTPNCFLYSADAEKGTRLPLPGWTVLTNAANSEEASSRRFIDSVLGGSAMMARFGAVLLPKVKSTLELVLNPRAAAASNSIRDLSLTSQTTSYNKASWDAIIGDEVTGAVGALKLIARGAASKPSTWDEARAELGLTFGQAMSVSLVKTLFWHWVQPISYFIILSLYYCEVARSSENFQMIALIVAVREVGYVCSTILACIFCPACLLLELDKEGLCGPRGGKKLGQLGMYALAPHHYISLALIRCFAAANQSVLASCVLFYGVFINGVMDMCGVAGIFLVLQMKDSPFALGIGYWYTACGYVFGLGGMAVNILLDDGVPKCIRVVYGGMFGLWVLPGLLAIVAPLVVQVDMLCRALVSPVPGADPETFCSG